MTIILGPDPNDLLVKLVSGSTWWATLRSVESASATPPTLVPFPAGATVELRFKTGDTVTTWAATIDGAEATWTKTAAEVSSLIAAAPATAGLWVTAGGQTLAWGLGRVSVRG